VNCDDGRCHKFAMLINLVFLIKVFFFWAKVSFDGMVKFAKGFELFRA